MFPAFQVCCGGCFSKRERRPDKGKMRAEPAPHADAEVFKLDLVFLAFLRESGSRQVTATVNPRLPYNVITPQFLESLGFTPASNAPSGLDAFTATLPGYCGWRHLNFDIVRPLSAVSERADFLVVDDHRSDDVVLGKDFKDVAEPLRLIAPSFVVQKGDR